MERKRTKSSKKSVEQKMRDQVDHIFAYLEVRMHDQIEDFINNILVDTGVVRAKNTNEQ